MEYSLITKKNTLEFNLGGKFTFSDNKIFNLFFEEISTQAYKQIIIDLAKLEFIDSAALGLLLLTREKCEKTSTTLTLRNPKGQVNHIFIISRFKDLFMIESQD